MMAPFRLTIATFLQMLVGFLTLFTSTTMATTVGGKPWADGPMKLVETPQHATGNTDLFTLGATHMALVHNAIIRGYNSIYLQAPHIQDIDKSDFIGYALTWVRFVQSHHDHEEDNLFGEVEKMLGGDENVWDETHKEHESFLGGLAEYRSYLESLPTSDSFSGTKLLSIMDTFHTPFEHHFHSEITTLAALSAHPKAPFPDSMEDQAARGIFKAWGKKMIPPSGWADQMPFFLVNLDEKEFEGGMWANWPPMPGAIKWVLGRVVGGWYGGWWRFGSCELGGERRGLYALEGRRLHEEDGEEKAEL